LSILAKAGLSVEGESDLVFEPLRQSLWMLSSRLHLAVEVKARDVVFDHDIAFGNQQLVFLVVLIGFWSVEPIRAACQKLIVK